jgi:hypothetical protein
MALSEAFHVAMPFKDFFTIKHPKWYEPQVSMDKKVKVPRKKVLAYEYCYASKNEENVDSSYVSSPANEHMDTHEALEPKTGKEIWEDKEENNNDTILFQHSDNVVWDEEPINGTVIWDEEEINVVDGMGDISLFDVNLETIFDRPCGEKSFLDEAMIDHDSIPPFGDCMVSSSEPIGFDEGSVLIVENKTKKYMVGYPMPL